MNDIYKEVHKKLNIYKLTKVQRAMFYQQIQDVIEQMDEEKIDEEFLDDLINDIFAYNDIDKVLERKQNKFNFNNIFWGLLLIFFGGILIFTDISIWDTIIITFIPLTVYFLVKRWFLLSILVFYIAISNVLDFDGYSFSLTVGLVIIYIGIKILFSSKKTNVKYHKFAHQGKAHAKHIKEKYNNYYEGEIDIKENIDSEVLFINNTYNGTNLDLTEENINYINLQNKCGGVELNLKSFKFPKGDLVINANNLLGGISIYLNDETEAKFLVDSKFGGVGSQHKYKTKDQIKNKVYIQGTNKFGGIDVL